MRTFFKKLAKSFGIGAEARAERAALFTASWIREQSRRTPYDIPVQNFNGTTGPMPPEQSSEGPGARDTLSMMNSYVTDHRIVSDMALQQTAANAAAAQQVAMYGTSTGRFSGQGASNAPYEVIGGNAIGREVSPLMLDENYNGTFNLDSLGIFSENEVYTLRARVTELEAKNKQLEEALCDIVIKGATRE